MKTVAVFAAFLGTGLCPQLVLAQSSSEPPAVLVEKAQSQKPGMADVYIGRVQAVNSVEIRARVEGTLEERLFEEGGTVQSGDTLYQIEDDLYQASVNRASALLDGAIAKAKNSEIDFERQKTLLEKGDAPQSLVDEAAATLGGDKASVEEARAELEQANINLGFTTITSPIDGRISKSSVDAGNLVSTGTGVLATITSVDPIHVSFFASERDLILKRQEGLIAENSASLDVLLKLSDGAAYVQSGTINYISNEIETATDTIELRAVFDNPDGLLIPGQVVTATFDDPNETEVVVIPQTAIQLDSNGHFVFVVGDGDVAARRGVQLGEQVGRDWVVTSGLKTGETVIIQGLQKVREGEKVSPTETQS